VRIAIDLAIAIVELPRYSKNEADCRKAVKDCACTEKSSSPPGLERRMRAGTRYRHLTAAAAAQPITSTVPGHWPVKGTTLRLEGMEQITRAARRGNRREHFKEHI